MLPVTEPGSRAVPSLTPLGLGREIDCVVDGKVWKLEIYVGEDCQETVAPGLLSEHGPEGVIVTNPVCTRDPGHHPGPIALTVQVVTVGRQRG